MAGSISSGEDYKAGIEISGSESSGSNGSSKSTMTSRSTASSANGRSNASRKEKDKIIAASKASTPADDGSVGGGEKVKAEAIHLIKYELQWQVDIE